MAERRCLQPHPEVPEVTVDVCPLVTDRHGRVGRRSVHPLAVVENLNLAEAIAAGEEPDRTPRRTGIDAVVD